MLVGFVITYRPGQQDVARVNTRSLDTTVGMEGSPVEPAQDEPATSQKMGAQQMTKDKILAVKALPSHSSVESSQDRVRPLTEKQTIDHVCEDIQRAMLAGNVKEAGSIVEDKDIVSLQEARKSTGYVEQWTHSIKRFVWG